MGNPQRIALITGGGQGLGKCLARSFLVSGSRVIIAENDEEAGRETEAEYASLGPLRFVRTNVAEESSVRYLLGGVAREYGRLDVLVNNAGIFVLAAEENGFITGANFVVDGGMTRKMIYAE